tara:strand:- start:99 stop:230 length:132 start_codon:yes stop_codon:yes gene_type:complete
MSVNTQNKILLVFGVIWTIGFAVSSVASVYIAMSMYQLTIRFL